MDNTTDALREAVARAIAEGTGLQWWLAERYSEPETAAEWKEAAFAGAGAALNAIAAAGYAIVPVGKIEPTEASEIADSIRGIAEGIRKGHANHTGGGE